MKITNVKIYNLSFGYSHEIKTIYKKGLIKIDYDFYGDKLEIDTATLEHLEPHSKGGKTTESNLVLATKRMNQARGNKPLIEFYNPEAAERYYSYFKGVVINKFNGDRYIKLIKKTVERLLREGRK